MIVRNGRVAANALTRRPLRSALIIATIAIGIAAVVTTLSTTAGLREVVRHGTALAGRRVSAVHRDLFYLAEVMAGRRPPTRRIDLRWRDLARLIDAARVEGLREEPHFIPTDIAYAWVDAPDGEKRRSVLVATGSAYESSVGYGLEAGRFMSEEEVRRGRPIAVLDHATAQGLWAEVEDPEEFLGRRIEIASAGRRLELEVIGVFEEPFGMRARMEAFDTLKLARPAIFTRLELSNVYAPVSLIAPPPPPGAPRVTIGGIDLDPSADAVGLIVDFGSEDLEDLEEWETRARSWAEDEGIAIFILPQWEWIQRIGELVGQADVAGAFIWVVILLVTIVMILVVNLVVVRERFPELAIRRTEGARRSDIAWQFVLESLILSTVGGCLGLGLGFVAAELLSRWVTDWPPAYETSNFVIALVSSALVGLLANLAPAIYAARLDPVKVLSKR